MQGIAESELRNQAYKYYLLMIAWPVYVLFLPMVYARYGLTSVLYMVFPGAYLYVWLACLMHECWHKYTPTVSNDFFYNTFSYMLFTDPQLYRMLHGHHHSKVNTWDDREFHPVGFIQNPIQRRLYNIAEILLGIIWNVGAQMVLIPKDETYKDKYSNKGHYVSMGMWLLIYGGLGCISASIFGVTVWQIIVPYTIGYWIGSLFLHHTQLVEHGNLIVEGDYHHRNIASRNLRRNGIPERIFHFITHGDMRQHVLHHTLVKLNVRPFPYRIPSPDDAVFISMRQYMGILWEMAAKG
jgi:fatty acid desaturase